MTQYSLHREELNEGAIRRGKSIPPQLGWANPADLSGSHGSWLTFGDRTAKYSQVYLSIGIAKGQRWQPLDWLGMNTELFTKLTGKARVPRFPDTPLPAWKFPEPPEMIVGVASADQVATVSLNDGDCRLDERSSRSGHRDNCGTSGEARTSDTEGVAPCTRAHRNPSSLG